MLSGGAHSSAPQCRPQTAYLGQTAQRLGPPGSLGRRAHPGSEDLRCGSRNTYKSKPTRRSGPAVQVGEGPGVTVPVPPFVGAAVFGVVVELGQTLAKAVPDTTLLQEGHGQLVLLLHKSLQSTEAH